MKNLLKINLFLLFTFFAGISVFAKTYDTLIYTKFFKEAGFKYDSINIKGKEDVLPNKNQNAFIETFSQPDNHIFCL